MTEILPLRQPLEPAASDSAVRIAIERRENILMQLSGGEGPVASE